MCPSTISCWNNPEKCLPDDWVTVEIEFDDGVTGCRLNAYRLLGSWVNAETRERIPDNYVQIWRFVVA